ncbi:MAG: hypothetical protein ACLT98_05845 [Eggerthellaceae bacterium]
MDAHEAEGVQKVKASTSLPSLIRGTTRLHSILPLGVSAAFCR